MPDPRISGEAKLATADLPPIRPVSSLFSNSLSMGAANVASRAFGYSYFILMARRLEARYIGAYALLVTTSMLMELVANLGLDKILIREIALSPSAEGRGFFWTALPIRLGMGLLCGVSAWTLLMLFFKDALLAGSLASGLFLTSIFPIVAARNCEAFLTAHEHLLPIAISQLSERLVILAGVLLLFGGVIGFRGLVCVTPVASTLRLGVVAWYMPKIWTQGGPSKRPNVRGLLRQAGEVFSVEVLAQVYFRSDVFLLAKMGGLRETGVYQITYKIFDVCISLFTGFLQAAYPRLVRSQSRRSLQVMLAGGTAILAVPVAVIILSRHFILTAVKPEYVSGSSSLVWLMLSVPLVYITSTLANAAVAAGQVRLLIGLAVLLLVTNVGMNLILIPRWSIDGAAFSTFACELFSAAVLCPIVLRRITWSPR
jgi:O-antigen/teichoic acid export membrane protein